MKALEASDAETLFQNKIIGTRELRANISEVVDRVINKFEIIVSGNVKKNNKDTAVIMASKALEDILAAYKFNPVIHLDEHTGLWEVLFEEIKLYGIGDTQEEAMEIILDMVIDSTEEYFEKTDLYMRIPELRAQMPYFLKIKQCQDREELKKVLSLV